MLLIVDDDDVADVCGLVRLRSCAAANRRRLTSLKDESIAFCICATCDWTSIVCYSIRGMPLQIARENKDDK
jgi:hypothetical protein